MPGKPESTDGEWAVRLRNPGDFQQDSFRRITMKRDKPRVFGIVGRLKNRTQTTLQSVRFPKEDGWTAAQCAEWMDQHPDLGKALEVPDLEEEGIVGLEARAVDEVDEPLWLLQVKQPDPEGKRLAALFGLEVKSIDKDEHTVDVWASSARIDHDREVVEPDGMVILSKRIPLVSSHNYRSLTFHIGEVPVKSLKKEGRRIAAQPRYLAGKGNFEADWAWVLVEEDLAAYSIGFRPRKWEDADLNDEAVLAVVREGKKPLRRHTEWELVELSHVVVPSQRDAVQRMAEKGVISQDEADSVTALLDLQPAPPAVALEKLEAALDRWAKMREQPTPQPAPEPEMEAEPQPDDVLALFIPPRPAPAVKAGNWKVGGARGLPLSEDASWDAGAARASLGDDLRVWRRAHIVYDASAADQKGSYKLPFARREGGTLRASKSGLQAARQRLSATDIPADVKAAAGRFIDSYLGKQDDKGETITPPLPVTVTILLGEYAALGVDVYEVKGEDGQILFRGHLADLEDRLAQAAQTTISKVEHAHAVELQANGLQPVLDGFRAALLADLTAALKQAAPAAPAFPEGSAAYVALSDLLDSMKDIAERVAQQVVAKVQGNVDAFIR